MNQIPAADESFELQRRLAAGESAAFAELYDRFGGRLFRTARRYLGNSTDAEDVVQELFVSLFRSRRQLAAVDNLAAYLFVGLRRRVARTHQRRPDAVQLARANVAVDPTTADQTLFELRDLLAVALDRLPDEQREVVILKIDSELTFQEIGQVLELSPNTIASRYRYALDKLRGVIEQEEQRRVRPT